LEIELQEVVNNYIFVSLVVIIITKENKKNLGQNFIDPTEISLLKIGIFQSLRII
jgi:hypothetical protein